MTAALARSRPGFEPPVHLTTDTRLLALLRWRARWALAHVPPREAAAVRVVELLLSTTTRHPRLRGDPPGLSTPPRHAAPLARAARLFNLPAPGNSATRRLVRALVVVPRPKALDVFVCVDRVVGERERGLVEEFVRRVGTFLAEGGSTLQLFVVGPDPFSTAGPHRDRVVAFGGLVCGKFDPLPLVCDRVPTPHELLTLAEHAPTPIARLGLVLLAANPSPVDAAVLRAVEETDTMHAARPDRLVSAWLGGAGAGASFDEALSLSSPDAIRRLPAAQRAARLLGALRAMSIASMRTVRGLVPASNPWRRRAQDEFFACGLPDAFAPALGQALRQAAGQPLPVLELESRPGRPSVARLGGVALVEANRPELAHARALALATRALGSAPRAVAPGITWTTRLAARPPPHVAPGTWLILDATPGTGSPPDPLNSGPSRINTVVSAGLLRTPLGRRATFRELPVQQAALVAAHDALAGREVTPVAAAPSAEPVTARLQRLARWAAQSGTARAPLAIESGGAVTLLGARPLRFAPDRVARRPRHFLPDPEAPDLAFAGPRAHPPAAGARSLVARLTALADEHLSVHYSTPGDGHLSERVELTALSAYLRVTQTLAREAGALLFVQSDVGIDSATALAGVSEDPVVQLRVFLDARRRLGIEIAGERFGAGRPHGWRTAAECVLSAWPVGVHGTIAVTDVLAPDHASVLVRLWARSAAARRLSIHLAQLLDA